MPDRPALAPAGHPSMRFLLALAPEDMTAFAGQAFVRAWPAGGTEMRPPTLSVQTTDGWTTEHPGVENLHQDDGEPRPGDLDEVSAALDLPL